MKKIVIALGIIVSALFSSPAIHALQTTKPVIAQYFGIWTEPGQTWEQKFREDTPFDKLNRLYISFAKIVKTEDGHFTLDFDGDVRHAQAIIDRMHQVNPAADILLTVGGNGDAFAGAARDPQFAENVLKFLTRYSFNGMDVDWEMGLNRQDLNAIITNLYTTLHGNGLKLTLDVWPFVNPAYEMPVLKAHLDQINIMSYGAGMSLAYVANQFIQAGFPAEKIIGGLETESDYMAGTDSLGPNGSIHTKSAYALNNGLAGMMGWRLDNDYTTKDNRTWPTYQGALELWSVMNK